MIAAPPASVAGLEGEHEMALTVPTFAVGTQVGLLAIEPPLLVQTSVSPANDCPGATAVGTTVNAGLMAATTTIVVADALLLPGVGSVVTEDTVAVSLIALPPTAAGLTVTTRVNTELATGIAPMDEHAMDPPLPTAGKVHDQPAGVTSDANVVPVGIGLFMAADAAGFGPALVTVIV